MDVLFVVMVGLIVISMIIGPFLLFFSVLFFCVATYFAWLVIFFAWTNNYDNELAFSQFQRFHGAEHAAIQMITKKEDLTIDNIKKESYYDSECGTSYAGNWVVLCGIVSLLILNMINIGFLKAILYAIATILLLFINFFNPSNPFKLLQYKAVKKPTEREYLLAIELAKKIME